MFVMPAGTNPASRRVDFHLEAELIYFIFIEGTSCPADRL
jgi:hypothetical protein